MINNIKSLIILSMISLFFNSSVIANEQFNFNISEINILEDGNKIKFTIMFRGREIARKDAAMQMLENVADSFNEISEIDKFKIKFDFIFSNVVFHYFDNYSYANNLIKKMLSNLNSNGTIYITNIPDLNKKNLYFKEIINNIGLKEYNKRYNKNTHLFYDKLFFKQIAKKNKLNVKIFDESLTSSKNYKFRFNVIFEKTK